MYEYDRKIITTAKNYNIQERDVIFSYLVAAGITRADAYHVIFERNTKGTRNTNTPAGSDTQAAELLKNKPGMKILIAKIKNRQQINHPTTQDRIREETEEEENKKGDELATRAGLVKKLRSEIIGVHGKDSVQGLISLAKLEGFDKEDTRKEDERRCYFVPFWSLCRFCALFKAYRETSDTETANPGK